MATSRKRKICATFLVAYFDNLFLPVLSKVIKTSISRDCTRMAEINRISSMNWVPQLKWVSKSFSKVYIVVDGLDECSMPGDLLSEISNEIVTPPNVKMLVVSRPEPGNTQPWTGFEHLEIEDVYVETDLTTYIDWRLNHDIGLKHIRSQIKRRDQRESLPQKLRNVAAPFAI